MSATIPSQASSSWCHVKTLPISRRTPSICALCDGRGQYRGLLPLPSNWESCHAPREGGGGPHRELCLAARQIGETITW